MIELSEWIGKEKANDLEAKSKHIDDVEAGEHL